MKIKYLKPVLSVLFVALAISLTGTLILADSTESKKVIIQETPTASTVIITTPETTTVAPETTTTVPETTTTVAIDLVCAQINGPSPRGLTHFPPQF